MASKQDRISEAMKERIAQLEGELGQCRNHLAESIRRGETLESDLEALQNEAHGVVAQWAEKATELQTKLDESLSEGETLKNRLLLQEKRHDALQCRLQDAETTNLTLTEESDRLKEVHKELAEKLAVAEGDFCSASERIVQYESLVNKMELEIKQSVEDIKSLVQDKNELVESVAKLREERQQVGEAYLEARSLNGALETELASHQRRVFLYAGVMMLAEEERRARDEITFACLVYHWDCMLTELRYQLHGNVALEAKNKTLEENVDVLRGAKVFLEAELQSTRADLSSVRQSHAKTSDELREQIRLLEQDISELQDVEISMKRAMESLKKELQVALLRCGSLESVKDDLEAEFRVVKDCYSTLLLEHNELKVLGQRREEEMNTKITSLMSESSATISEYEVRLHSLLTERMSLRQVVSFTKLEALERMEHVERLSLVGCWYGAFMQLASAHCAKLSACLHDTRKQLSETKKEVIATGNLLDQRVAENRILREGLDASEKNLTVSRTETASLESRMLGLTSELDAAQKACDEVKADNNWLLEEVESMRLELGEINGMLKVSLDNRMEEKESHELLREKLLCEIQQHDGLLQQSQAKVDLLNERCATLLSENAAISKTLSLAEKELENTKREHSVLQHRQGALAEQKRHLETTLSRIQIEHTEAARQISLLKEQIQTQDAKLQLISASSRRELEATKMKLNSFIEKYEDAEQRVSHVSKHLQESEDSASSSREAYQKARAALEEAKQRCCSDMETIQKLLSERQSLIKDRDSLAEKYNRVHDMLKAIKRESSGKLANEVQKLTDLCCKQEVELQQLRHQNVALKRGIMRLPDGAGTQVDRQKFMKPLNVTEGPLRRPKKRVAMSLDTH